jgi:translation initiation factor eIF-2B subunit beta
MSESAADRGGRRAVGLADTGRGDHSPSYIYRIIKEAYDDEDIEL